MLVAALGGPWTLVQLGLLLLGLAGLALWLRRRIAMGTADATRSCVRLTAEHAVFSVELEGRRYLLGTGPGGPPVLLAELEPIETEITDPGLRPEASMQARAGWSPFG